MAISRVAGFATGQANDNPTTSNIDSTGANFLLGSIAENGSGTQGVPGDSKSNSYSSLTIQDSGAGGNRSRFDYATNGPVVGTGHNFVDTQLSVVGAVAFAAYSGVHATAPFDTGKEAGAQSGSAVSIQPGSVTPSVNGCLIVVTVCFDVSPGTVTADSGFTVVAQLNPSGSIRGIAIAELIQTSAAAVNPTISWTNLSGVTTRIAVFKPSSDVTQLAVHRTQNTRPAMFKPGLAR